MISMSKETGLKATGQNDEDSKMMKEGNQDDYKDGTGRHEKRSIPNG
jgi:hypothetical protein